MKKRDAVTALLIAAAGLFTLSSSEVGTQTPSCLVNTTCSHRSKPLLQGTSSP